MANKAGKTVECNRAEALKRLATAKSYQVRAGELAETEADRQAAAGNAVLAGIAAADAICCVRLGRTSKSSNPQDSITLLTQVDKGLADSLRVLISKKDLAHYGGGFVNAEVLKTLRRNSAHLIEVAEAAVTS